MQAPASGQPFLADVCEALIGAVFLDGGYPAAGVVERLWHERMQAAQPLRDREQSCRNGRRRADCPRPFAKVSRSGRPWPCSMSPFSCPILLSRVRPFQARSRTGRRRLHAVARRREDQDRTPQWLSRARRRNPRRAPPAAALSRSSGRRTSANRPDQCSCRCQNLHCYAEGADHAQPHPRHRHRGAAQLAFIDTPGIFLRAWRRRSRHGGHGLRRRTGCRHRGVPGRRTPRPQRGC